MSRGHIRTPTERARIAVSFYAITFMGIGAGANGVLLPAQLADFAISKSTVGLMFLAFSLGYIATAMANGVLIHRLGVRMHLVLGICLALVTAGLTLAHPSFAAFLVLQVGYGFGIGVLDAGFNSYLSPLPGSAALLNFFHAFFGVGALIGPVIAAALLSAGLAWNAMYGLLAAVLVPLLASTVLFPAAPPVAEAPQTRPPISGALRLAAVWLTAAFLAVYVGLETGMGNWGFTFLTEERGRQTLAAGWIISAFWGGLTVGRFTLNAMAERFGVGMVALSGTCIAGVAVSSATVWLVPTAGVATVGFVFLGFFLGPMFPTVIAAVPRLVPVHLVTTAVGVLVAVSVMGGGAFPYLVGASAQALGAWALLPINLGLSVLLGLLWWRIALRLGAPAPPVPAGPGQRDTPTIADTTDATDLVVRGHES